jgi:hypothetical protein
VLRGKDYGPATKFIAPALVLPDEERFVYLDDDTDYPLNLFKVLSMFRDGVWGLSGFTFSEYFSKNVSRSHAKEVDVIEGYGGVCIQAKIIKNNLPKILELIELTCMDDMIMSNLLHHLKVPIRTVCVQGCNVGMVRQYQFGFGPDALHHISGEGTHLENYKRILQTFTDKKVNYFKY